MTQEDLLTFQLWLTGRVRAGDREHAGIAVATALDLDPDGGDPGGWVVELALHKRQKPARSAGPPERSSRAWSDRRRARRRGAGRGTAAAGRGRQPAARGRRGR